MQERRRGGFRRLAVLFAVASVGVLAVGAHAASAASIEVCKSGANGMTGQAFQFTVNGGSPITVVGGRCSGGIPVTGSVTVAELPSAGTDVQSIRWLPSGTWTGVVDLPNGKVTINTAGNPTANGLVTFTNEPAGGNIGTLKICKVTTTPGLVGSPFSFQTGPVGGPLGNTVTTTPANDAFADPATWTCTVLGNFQVGSNVHVHEQIPAGIVVSFIDADPGSALGLFDTGNGDANVTVGSGVTEVLYGDEPAPTNQNGFIEVCKAPAFLPGTSTPDPAVTGPFTFNIVDANGKTYTQTVTVPSPNLGLTYCASAPLQIAAGLATVTEVLSPSFQLDDILVNPANAQVGENLNNGSVTVNVPATTNQNNEVQVTFVNEHVRAQLKVCKALGPNSGDLANLNGNGVFHFTLTDVTDPTAPKVLTSDLPVPAGSCTVFGNVTLGDTVNVTENGDRTTAPFSFIDTTGEGPVTIANGINTVTITNTAKGNLEICKRLTSPWTVTPTNPAPVFQFRVDGGSIVNVTATLIGQPLKCVVLRVAPGAHTVTEGASNNFELDPNAPGGGITSNNTISTNTANRSIIVNVPFAGDTFTTFFNRIKQFQVKVCKFATSGSSEPLSSVLFNYNWAVDGQGSGTLFPTGAPAQGIHVGECAFISDGNGNPRNFNLIGPMGFATVVSLGEIGATDATPAPFGSYFVSNLQVSGRRTGPGTVYNVNPVPNPQSPVTGLQYRYLPVPPAPVANTYHVMFTPGPGVNEGDFTNTAGG